MPTSSERVRFNAEECCVIADVFREDVTRAELLMLVEQYEHLADTIARITGTAFAAP